MQKLRRCRIQLGVQVDLLSDQGLVGLALACLCPRARSNAAGAHAGAGLAGRSLQQILCGQGGYSDMQVDAVHQGTAQAALVARDLVRSAAAALLAAAQVAAGAGVHGANQLKARRKLGAPGRPGNADAAGFQRLAQRLQGRAFEFGEFVQKQHAVVGQGNFSRWGRRAATHQGHGAG